MAHQYNKTNERERFIAKVDSSAGFDACWRWIGAMSGKYGNFDRDGAHRVAFRLCFGAITSGMFVCHRCDNPRCVNPMHLFLGTATDNNHDKMRKGRDTRGSTVNTARLTDEHVAEIRAAYADGVSQPKIAAHYSIVQPHVSTIVRGKAWNPIGADGALAAPRFSDAKAARIPGRARVTVEETLPLTPIGVRSWWWPECAECSGRGCPACDGAGRVKPAVRRGKRAARVVEVEAAE